MKNNVPIVFRSANYPRSIEAPFPERRFTQRICFGSGYKTSNPSDGTNPLLTYVELIPTSSPNGSDPFTLLQNGTSTEKASQHGAPCRKTGLLRSPYKFKNETQLEGSFCGLRFNAASSKEKEKRMVDSSVQFRAKKDNPDRNYFTVVESAGAKIKFRFLAKATSEPDPKPA